MVLSHETLFYLLLTIFFYTNSVTSTKSCLAKYSAI